MRIFFSVLGLSLLASGAFAQNLDLEDLPICIEMGGTGCSVDSVEPSAADAEVSNLDRALRGVEDIGRGAAEIGRAAVDAADERAPEAMDVGRNLIERASGFFEEARDRFRPPLHEEGP